MLYENQGWLDCSYERIAFELRTQSELIKSIIEDFDLFVFDKAHKKFSSRRVLDFMKFIKDKSEKSKISANIKWNKYYAAAKRTHSESKATAMQIKENKIKENKTIESMETPSTIANNFFTNVDEQERISKEVSERYKTDILQIKQEIYKFISYWTEPTKSGKLQRWQTQTTFEVGRRLSTWFNNAREFKQKSLITDVKL